MDLSNTTETSHSEQSGLTPLLTLQKSFFNELKSKGRSLNTLKNYKTDLDCFNDYLLSHQKSLSIKDFDLAQVKLYGDYLQTKYSSDNSRRRRVQTLRIFFDYLVEKYYFSTNPVRSLPTSPKFLDRPRPTSFIDLKTLWQSLMESSHDENKMNSLIARRNSVLVLFIYGAGLKVSDLHKLKEQDIIFSDEGKARVIVHHPKRDPYTIPLPEIFSDIYLAYKRALEEEKNRSQLNFDHVLFNANAFRIIAGGLSPRGIEMIFEEYRKKLIVEVTAKSLRQACVFRWLQEDNADTTIKEWMGVAPSYSLKLYKTYKDDSVYTNQFLGELYTHAQKKSRSFLN